MRLRRDVERARAAGLVALVAAASLLTACGDNTISRSDAPDHEPSSSVSTTSAGPPEDTGADDVSWASSGLPPCGDQPAYRTRPRWLPNALPGGLVLASGGTERYESQESSPAEMRTYALVDVADDGAVRSSLRLVEGGGVPPHAQPVPGEPGLGSVRGNPGSVHTYINRSNQPWVQALWVEGGQPWSASADRELGVDGLAAALEPLALEPGAVSDPTGRFQVLAGDVVPAGDRTVGRHTTTLALDPHGSDVDPLVLVQVEERGPGAHGPGSASLGGDLSAVQVDGRWVISSPMGASVGLEDGSSATAMLRTSVALAQSQPGGSTTTLPGAVVITEADLRQIVLGITSAEATVAGDVRIPSHWLDTTMSGIELCDAETVG